MRYSLVLGAIALATALWSPAKSSAMEGIPPGSYRESCRDIRVRGNSLEAVCMDAAGSWRQTYLDGFERCSSDVTNENGRLTCARNVPPPKGSYAKSCKGIRLQYNTLHARCQTRDGRTINASLDHAQQCRWDIENVDGQLRCQAGAREFGRGREQNRDSIHAGDQTLSPATSTPRRGSYSMNCRDIHMLGDTLLATCQTIDGRWIDASLSDVSHCVGDIVNRDGHLECTRSDRRGLPRGSYVETCRDIYVRGDVLRASCRALDGSWRWSELSDWERCSAVVNDNGRLVCAGR